MTQTGPTDPDPAALPPRPGEGALDDGRSAPRHGRAALLRLARWFEGADPEAAHRLFTAAFALYPARHLEGQGEDTVAATTGWWDAPPSAGVAVRSARRSAPGPVHDHTEQQTRLRDAAEAAAHWRRSAAQEVRDLLAEPTRDGDRPQLSGAALEVLMGLLTAALGTDDAASGAGTAADLELDIRLRVIPAPGATLTLREAGGELVLRDLSLHATRYAGGTDPSVEPDSPTESSSELAHPA
ncbi:DUF2397 family protein [Marinactinospora thermotolerans]|uniref:DUF2397 family protein n=1 Tax=Marinactinospora thermotolerans DSM 45154 TaxID=1122192 RepID=A0A1T4STN2_9ACTN|nr:DUF2397 family protein [Marinactinospora thermotolerans]SKA31537.1 Protein of unknown function [Marinactinospora thermotolerans DSM 45154]